MRFWNLKPEEDGGDPADGVLDIDGEIVIHYHNGTRFKGIYKNGKRNGPAIEEDKNGVRFEGSYKDDERDGKYVMKDKSGKVTETGTYSRGIKQPAN